MVVSGRLQCKRTQHRSRGVLLLTAIFDIRLLPGGAVHVQSGRLLRKLRSEVAIRVSFDFAAAG